MNTLWSEVEERGFCLLKGAIPKVLLQPLSDEVERLSELHRDQAHGLRGLLTLSHTLRAHAERLFELGLDRPSARPLRGILFDKRPDANWRIGWHQDTNLKEDGRSLISNDDLGRVFTLRIHLDATPASNGALKCLPGSHHLGRQAFFRRGDTNLSEHIIEAEAGDVLVMRPLLFHASSPASGPARRRVIHVDYLESDTAL